jgi:arylformamidase
MQGLEDPAWLDAQYNNRARIPEHPALFDGWRRRSEQARQALQAQQQAHLGLPYGSSPAETLDLFVPRRAAAPVLVFIHGGWWRTLDKDDHSFIAPAFVQSGAMVVVPNYGLCPAVSIEDIARQMAEAVAWVVRHAARWGGDPQRIVVVGHSAGAHLAALLLQCRWPQVGADLPAHLLRRAVGISGLYELDSVSRTPFLAPDLRLTAQAVRRLSPAWMPAPGHARFHAVVGAQESEAFLAQNRLIRQAWGDEVVPVCEELAGTHHLNVLHELERPGSRLHRLVLQQLHLV